jgi:hypothetical protein
VSQTSCPLQLAEGLARTDAPRNGNLPRSTQARCFSDPAEGFVEGFLFHDSPESVSGDQLGPAVRPNAAELHQIVLPFQQC